MRFLGITLALSIVGGAIAIATASGPLRPEPLPTALQTPDLVPGADEGAIAGVVARTLLTGHYSKGTIDDARSGQWLDKYIELLDSQRLYLLQSDIDEFEAKWSKTLDDDVLSPTPKLEAAYVIHRRFRDRVTERMDAIQRLLGGPLPTDDAKATLAFERKDVPWAASPAELDALWKARLTAQVIDMELGDKEGLSPVERLKKRYDRVRRDAFDVDSEDILEVYLSALCETFDPHSIWFKPVSKENFDIDMQDTLIGIGAVLNVDDGYVVIKELVVGGPADQSGKLHAGDKILAVGQDGAEPVDVVEMRLDRVVQLIRGKAGTTVHLTIKPADATDPSETRVIDIVRDKVKLDQAAAKGELRTIDGPKGPLHVGVLDVPSFYEDIDGERAGEADYGSTAHDVARLISGWKAEGKLDGLLVDLRENGGGSLDQALELTGLFLPGGPVVQVRGRDGQIEVLKDPDPAVFYDGPVVVLTSELSASASEIFAAALQDSGRALIVGSETTHGKGTVQNLLGLERQLMRLGNTTAAQRAGAIKFTTHMFYRINGDSTQLHGVSADVRLPSPFSGLDYRESDLDFALPWDQIPAAPHRMKGLGADVLALQAAADARVAADQELRWLAEDLARRDELEAKGTVSLDLATRRTELEAEEAREAERKAARGEEKPGEVAPVSEAVLEEALLVTRDYIAPAAPATAHKR